MKSRRVSITDHSFHTLSSEDAFCFYPTLSVFTHLLPFSLKGKCSGAVIRLREIINSACFKMGVGMVKF